MAKERCEIKAHPRLIYDVIQRQAGTLSKAVLEGVMNAIEAHDDPAKSVVDVTFDANGAEQWKPGAILRIKDNGKGIRNRQEIEDFFLTFGTPHSESEHKTWAQFRMGRGQIFSYGINTWRTSTFKMIVDIAKDKAAEQFPHCELEDGLPHVNGCDIEVVLYSNPVGDYGYTLESLKDEIRKQIEFMPGVIRFNGEQLNTPPHTLKWTEQDDDAYYLFNKGGDLAVYNMGAYVMSMSPTRAGVTGVVVSKTMLKVNFARNAVQEDSCEVWARIREVIKENRIAKVRKAARRLNGNERSATLLDLRDGNITLDEVKTIGLFETSSGRVLKLDDVRKNTLPWTFAEQGDRLADKWMQSGSALCINEDVLDALSYRGERKNFFHWLVSRADQWAARSWEGVANLYRSFESLERAEGNSRTSTIIPHDKLTKYERRIIKVLEYINQWDGRRVVIGISGCAYLAWTDGSSYIALNRDYVNRLSLTSGYEGAADLIHTMFHETAHDEDTAGTHHHGEEFYRRFHEITYRGVSGGSWCPLNVIGVFGDKMRRAAREEVTEAAIRREQKAKAQRDKALGLDKAKELIAARQGQVEDVPADNVESEAVPNAPDRPRHAKSRRRMPRNIM